MELVLNFNGWLFEAEVTKHFVGRKLERIEGLKTIEFPEDVVRKVSEKLGISPLELKMKLKDAVKDEVLSRIDDLEAKDFPEEIDIFYPILVSYFKFDGIKYPLTVVSKSKPKHSEEKVYKGNQIYVVIRENKLITIMLYDDQEDQEDIRRKGLEHIKRVFRKLGKNPIRIEVAPKNDSTEYILTIKDGDIGEATPPPTTGLNYTKVQQYNLGNGNLIKVYLPFKKDYVIGMIDGILNRNSYKTDNFIKVSLEANVGDKNLKIPKTLKPGDSVYLPIGPEGNEWIRCSILDPSYILDNRMGEPINLKFKAIKE